MYLWQLRDWPNMLMEYEAVTPSLSAVRLAQGRLYGKLDQLGFDVVQLSALDAFTEDAITTAAIEDVDMDRQQVRSSVARRLGVDAGGLVHSDSSVDGMVEMLIDATTNYNDPLTHDRLHGWHSALFHSGRSGMHRISVGEYRGETGGPMQVVSGPMNKQRVHFEAPPSSIVLREMDHFLRHDLPPSTVKDYVLFSGVAHLWFLTIHPFDDGNGRIARAISDYYLAKAEQSPYRYYSLSAEILARRSDYYRILEYTQRGDMIITEWMLWYLDCLLAAVRNADQLVQGAVQRGEFWQRHAQTVLSARQRKVLTKLLDNYDGKMTTSKWSRICKCSRDTALRDINDLVAKGVLRKGDAGSRSTGYYIKTLSQHK